MHTQEYKREDSNLSLTEWEGGDVEVQIHIPDGHYAITVTFNSPFQAYALFDLLKKAESIA